VLVFTGVFLAADGKDDAVKPERDAIQGKWLFHELTVAGINVPDKERKLLHFDFKENKVTYDDKVGGPFKGSYTLDPTKSPANLDLTFEYDGKLYTVRSIYELKGDMLTLCFSSGEDTPRPKAFEATPQTVLGVLKKLKR
jgi:uncharacterized protein (TIGR03067 family)